MYILILIFHVIIPHLLLLLYKMLLNLLLIIFLYLFPLVLLPFYFLSGILYYVNFKKHNKNACQRIVGGRLSTNSCKIFLLAFGHRKILLLVANKSATDLLFNFLFHLNNPIVYPLLVFYIQGDRVTYIKLHGNHSCRCCSSDCCCGEQTLDRCCHRRYSYHHE